MPLRAARRPHPVVALQVQDAGLRHPQDARAGGVEAGAEVDVLVPPAAVVRLAPPAQRQGEPPAVGDVAAVEAVVGMRMAVNRTGLRPAPVGQVPGAVGAGGRQVLLAGETPVRVGAAAEPVREADEPAQPEGRDLGAAGVAGGVGGDQARRGDDVVVQVHHHIAAGGPEAGVPRPGWGEPVPAEPQPPQPQAGPQGVDPRRRPLGGRALHHQDLHARRGMGLGGERPQCRRQVGARPSVWDDDAHRRPVPAVCLPPH